VHNNNEGSHHHRKRIRVAHFLRDRISQHRTTPVPPPSPSDPDRSRASRRHGPTQEPPTNRVDLELARTHTDVPSWTSSPAARSPKTCANRHSSGGSCGRDASPWSPAPGGSIAAVRHAIAPRGHRIGAAPDRRGEGSCRGEGSGIMGRRARGWGRRRRRRGRSSRGKEGWGWDATRERGGGEVMWGRGARSRSPLSLCASLSPLVYLCLCERAHISLYDMGHFCRWTLTKRRNILLTEKPCFLSPNSGLRFTSVT
jgi:hypothetical protein